MTPRIPSLSPSGMPSPISSKLQQSEFVGGVYASQQHQQKRSSSQPAARPSVYAADDGQSFDDGDDGVDYEDDADFEDEDDDELAPPSSRQAQQPHSNRNLHRHIAHGNSLYGDGGVALQDSCYVQRAPSVGAADGGAATGRSSVMSGYSAAMSSSTAAAASTTFRPTSGSASWGMRQQTHGAYANVPAFQQRGGSANNSRSATPVINDAAALSRAYGQAAVSRSRPTSAAAIARPPRPSSATARR